VTATATATATGTARWRPQRRGQLGLRARVTVAFALGALALSTILSSLTYGLVRSNLVQQRESSARAQAFVNARVARDGIPAPGGITRVLTSMESQGTGGVVLHVDDRWFASSLVLGRDVIPTSLRSRVAEGRAAQQRFHLAGAPWMGVGVPIPRAGAEFFQAFSLAEVERTLDILGYSLAGAALLTTMAGAAVGRWASARVLRPLASVSDAAAAIAQGALDIRLVSPPDRDLAPLADSFNSMVDALADRIEKDARFASDVSHELRSPLTTLSTSLDVLRARRDELSERSQAALDLLDADVRRFQRMVEDLLEISRFDAGVAELEVEEVDVRELVRHALAGQAHPVPLSLEDAAASTMVLGDKRRLERVLVNLVDNAAAYGGGATNVGVVRRNGTVRMVVEDRGAGVPPAERTKVFERFFRGSAAGRRGAGGGSGLGLALVVEHVRLHGGSVWVEDGPEGIGARFVVELPAAP
jgi:two-component system, OmpR family, sensor histidine kinase MtrB